MNRNPLPGGGMSRCQTCDELIVQERDGSWRHMDGAANHPEQVCPRDDDMEVAR